MLQTVETQQRVHFLLFFVLKADPDLIANCQTYKSENFNIFTKIIFLTMSIFDALFFSQGLHVRSLIYIIATIVSDTGSCLAILINKPLTHQNKLFNWLMF